MVDIKYKNAIRTKNNNRINKLLKPLPPSAKNINLRVKKYRTGCLIYLLLIYIIFNLLSAEQEAITTSTSVL